MATELDKEVAFLRTLLEKNRQQHRASKHFQLSEMVCKRAARLAPAAAADGGDAAAAAARCDALAEVALKAAKLTREVLGRGFFVALSAAWLACLARVLALAKQDAARLRRSLPRAAAPAAAAPPRVAAAAAAAFDDDDDDDLGEAVAPAERPAAMDCDDDAGAPAVLLPPAKRSAADVFYSESEDDSDDGPAPPPPRDEGMTIDRTPAVPAVPAPPPPAAPIPQRKKAKAKKQQRPNHKRPGGAQRRQRYF